ncbi:outer membrane beta-barrel protein [Chitinimonas sp. PSY-7]|uniref:outer membrane beta-barrel protein n=1 Tax=Chitinimonas sp. PSY-7 TaxID=3459088 RepID=UPI00403FC8B9
MKKHYFLLVIAGTLSMPVFAESAYIGAEVGRTNLKESDTSGVTDNFKGHATNFGVFGGYQFHPNAAIEVGYRDLGKIKDTAALTSNGVTVTANGTAKPQALHASLLGIFPVSNEFSMYVRFGAARMKVKEDFNYTILGVNASSSETTKKTKGMFGLGARYAVSKEFGLRAEYTQFSKVSDFKISSFTVGGDYLF